MRGRQANELTSQHRHDTLRAMLAVEFCEHLWKIPQKCGTIGSFGMKGHVRRNDDSVAGRSSLLQFASQPLQLLGSNGTVVRNEPPVRTCAMSKQTRPGSRNNFTIRRSHSNLVRKQ